MTEGALEKAAARLEFARRYLTEVANVLIRMPLDPIIEALAVLEHAYLKGSQVFLIGNGGSSATAAHLASDLVWTVAQVGAPGFRALALAENTPVVTAIANDDEYSVVFDRQLDTLANAGDVLVAISGSGASRNVIRAAEKARAKGLRSIGFTGKGGGDLAKLVDVAVIVPADDYGPIEDAHMVLAHLVTMHFREALAAVHLSADGTRPG